MSAYRTTARTKARIAGGLWLIVVAAGGFAQFVTQSLYVSMNPAATAVKLIASESQFRTAFVASFVAGVCYVGVTLILYELLKPVSRTLALLAGVLGITGSAVGFAVSVVQLGALVLLKADYFTAFTLDQRQSLAFASLLMNRQGFPVAMVLFGLQCLTVGYLVVRSTFLPRLLGVLLAIGGSGYVIGSFVSFVSPEAGTRLFPIMFRPGFIGELLLCLWLLAKGVNLRNWEEYSSHAVAKERLFTA